MNDSWGGEGRFDQTYAHVFCSIVCLAGNLVRTEHGEG